MEFYLELIRTVFQAVDNEGKLRNRIVAFQRILQDAGLLATIRKTRGEDIDAACGQLAGQVQDRTKRSVHRIQPVARP